MDTNLVLTIPAEGTTIAVTKLDSIPVEKVCHMNERNYEKRSEKKVLLFLKEDFPDKKGL